MGNRNYKQAKTKIDASLKYLKRCDNYSTKAAMLQVEKLRKASNICNLLNEKYKAKLAQHLINKEFAQLFVKIVTFLQGDSNGSDNEDREQCLRYIKGACTKFTSGTESNPFILHLISKGAISLLLQGLDTDKMQTSDSEITSTIKTLNILRNCVDCPDSIVRSTYRTANAVPHTKNCHVLRVFTFP